MMTAELFAVATKESPGLDRLNWSLSKFEVPITRLGQNEAEYWGHGWRWKTFIRAARGSSADIVIHCDAYDCICLSSMPDILGKFASLAHPIVFSYEHQEQPEFWLGLNSGLVIANREALVTAFDDQDLNAAFPNHLTNQYPLQRIFLRNPHLFKLDRDGILFHTLGLGSPELTVQDNRLINAFTGHSPSFVHGPRRGDLSSVEQWLASQN
jgi:hypothetical protein